MKKVFLGLAMIASLQSFAINPIKKSAEDRKVEIIVIFDGEGKYSVECGSVKATFEACSNQEAVTIAQRICPGGNIVTIVQAPKSVGIE